MEIKRLYDPFDFFDPLTGEANPWPLQDECMEIALIARHLLEGADHVIGGPHINWTSAKIRELSVAFTRASDEYLMLEEQKAIARMGKVPDPRLLSFDLQRNQYIFNIDADDEDWYFVALNREPQLILYSALRDSKLLGTEKYSDLEGFEPYAILSLQLVAEFVFHTRFKWSTVQGKFIEADSKAYTPEDYILFAQILLKAQEALDRGKSEHYRVFVEWEYEDALNELRKTAGQVTDEQREALRAEVQKDALKKERARADQVALQLAKRRATKGVKPV